MYLCEKNEVAEKLVQVKVAMATCGIASGARETMEFMTEALEKRGVDAIVTRVGCMGYCYAEPTIEVKLPGLVSPWYLVESAREKPSGNPMKIHIS